MPEAEDRSNGAVTPGGEMPAGEAEHYDAIVVGTGICGIYAVHKLAAEGYSVIGIESGENVGGVWHYNRYPGARVDVESTQYCYTFSEELYREWQWTERYSAQPELQRYFDHVVDKFDLRKRIMLRTRVTAARWYQDASRWRIETSGGRAHTCQFLVTALGNLTAPREPDFPGLADFKGERIQTSRWPDRPVAIAGRRIGVFGTGSSGVQCVPRVAVEAAHVAVFQRSPNFSIPARNHPLTDPEGCRPSDFAAFRAAMMAGAGACIFPPSRGSIFQYGEAEREAILEEFWSFGGHAFARAFDGIVTDPDTNRIVSDFVARKIAETVQDERTAAALIPTDHGLGTRRVCVDTGYYEAFNRDNVTLVDLRTEPLVRFTPHGVETRSHHHDLDLVIFALGFRAFTGALEDADIRNAQGEAVTDRWGAGWKTYLGYMTTGFPNLLMISGPGGITLSANVPISAEYQVDWLVGMMNHMKDQGLNTVEPRTESQERWRRHVAETDRNHAAMKTDISNWWIRKDPETGERICMTFLGGWPAFVAACEAETEKGYSGFRFR